MDHAVGLSPIIRDFLAYHEVIRGHSKKTVDEYYLDLRTFFRYIKVVKGRVPKETVFDSIPVDDVDMDLIRSVTVSDVYDFLTFLSRDRARIHNSPETGYGLNAASRARKVACIRSFYKYLSQKALLLDHNRCRISTRRKSKRRSPATFRLTRASACSRAWTARTGSATTVS
jgi:site-specific recombinase XerD